MMDKMRLQKLEQKIDQLIDNCERLQYENQQLREQKGQLQNERDTLLKKTSLARVRLESMIERLKILESDA